MCNYQQQQQQPFHNTPFVPLAALFTRALTTRVVSPFLTTCTPTQVFVNVTTRVSLALWRHAQATLHLLIVCSCLQPFALLRQGTPCFATLVHSCLLQPWPLHLQAWTIGGFTLLTMTDLTSPQRLQLKNYLRCHTAYNWQHPRSMTIDYEEHPISTTTLSHTTSAHATTG